MPKLQITAHNTGAMIYEAEAADLLTLVQMGAKDGADMYRANLEGAYLRGANLRGANLIGANLDPEKLPVIQIGGSHHWITMLGAGDVRIGCKAGSLEWWLEHYAAVGRAEGYTAAQVAEYKSYLDLLKARASAAQEKEYANA